MLFKIEEPFIFTFMSFISVSLSFFIDRCEDEYFDASRDLLLG